MRQVGLGRTRVDADRLQRGRPGQREHLVRRDIGVGQEQVSPGQAGVSARACRVKPDDVCLVPEKRAELTTEGGLDVIGGQAAVAAAVAQLQAAGIRVSLFIDPEPKQIDAAAQAGATVIELHTGAYCDAGDAGRRVEELARLTRAAREGADLGLEVHAGHGLTFDNVAPVAALPEIAELNIGHFLIGEAIFGGLDSTIKRMRALMDKARAEVLGARTA